MAKQICVDDNEDADGIKRDKDGKFAANSTRPLKPDPLPYRELKDYQVFEPPLKPFDRVRIAASDAVTLEVLQRRWPSVSYDSFIDEIEMGLFSHFPRAFGVLQKLKDPSTGELFYQCEYIPPGTEIREIHAPFFGLQHEGRLQAEKTRQERLSRWKGGFVYFFEDVEAYEMVNPGLHFIPVEDGPSTEERQPPVVQKLALEPCPDNKQSEIAETLKAKDISIAGLDFQLSEAKKTIEEQTATIAELKEQIAELEAQFAAAARSKQGKRDNSAATIGKLKKDLKSWKNIIPVIVRATADVISEEPVKRSRKQLSVFIFRCQECGHKEGCDKCHGQEFPVSCNAILKDQFESWRAALPDEYVDKEDRSCLSP